MIVTPLLNPAVMLYKKHVAYVSPSKSSTSKHATKSFTVCI